jgi:3-oxoacyl-[acyl-carrier protein] reductase
MRNKNIIITGASQGIGESITEKFFNNHSNVFLISRNKNKLQKIKERLSKKKNTNQIVTYYIASVENFNDILDIVKTIINKYKQIDVLINNAGITDDNLIVKMKEEQWDKVIDTNLKGTYNCCKAVSKYMIKQKFGKIINISSVIGEIGNKGQVNYAASKAGIIGLTKSLSKELGSRNININAINPGFINTEMTKNLETDKNIEFLNKIPLNRFGTVDEVSNLAYFLASNDSDYITGQSINIDGGMVV